MIKSSNSNKQITTPDKLQEDTINELSLRPTSFNDFIGELPNSILKNEGIEEVYVNSNHFSGYISDDFCSEEVPIHLLIYDNNFCPPFPNCVHYIGDQKCKN